MATGATEFIDTVSLKGGTGAQANNPYVPQVWSRVALVSREKQLVFAEKVNRVYEKDLADFGDIVHVPSVSDLAVRTKDAQTSSYLGGNNTAVTFETVTEANTDIIINVWEYTAIAIETAAARLSNKDMLKLYAHKMGYALAKSVDSVLAAYITSGASGNAVGTLTIGLGYDDVLQARQNLDDFDVPPESRAFIVSPAQERGFMGLDQFIHRDYDSVHGDPGKMALNQAYMGSWMNTPIYKSTNVAGTNAAGHDNTLLHKEALALVMAINATTHTFFDINYLANKVVVEQLYGSAIMRNGTTAGLYSTAHYIRMKGL